MKNQFFTKKKKTPKNSQKESQSTPEDEKAMEEGCCLVEHPKTAIISKELMRKILNTLREHSLIH